MSIEMVVLNPAETKRTYHFGNGDSVTLENVTHLAVRSSGTHRIQTGDGKLHIVPPTWIHIEIEADGWSL